MLDSEIFVMFGFSLSYTFLSLLTVFILSFFRNCFLFLTVIPLLYPFVQLDISWFHLIPDSS